MANYWIRNRGRIQGPLSLERIKGLMRRGRFSRHFHVSLDKKEWLPAEEFPELFETGRRRRGASADDDFDDDDTPFQSGRSPFDDDDDDDRPARKSKSKSAKRRAAVVDDDEDEEDDDDEDWEDDEEWEDDDGGMFDSLTGMIEANIKPIAALLILVLAGLGWFMLTGESFGTDIADMETVIEVNERITIANAVGQGPSEWAALQDSVMAEIAPLIDRLETTANARDHVKQELLFISRDYFPDRFKELPNGIDKATIRITQSLARIDEMIKEKKRQHPGTIMGNMMPLPAQNSSVPGQPGATPNANQQNNPPPNQQAEQDGGSMQQSPQMPNPNQPAGGNNQGASGNNQGTPPASGMQGAPNGSPPPASSGIPGRPPASKF